MIYYVLIIIACAILAVSVYYLGHYNKPSEKADTGFLSQSATEKGFLSQSVAEKGFLSQSVSEKGFLSQSVTGKPESGFLSKSVFKT